jgi:hypothetical protein
MKLRKIKSKFVFFTSIIYKLDNSGQAVCTSVNGVEMALNCGALVFFTQFSFLIKEKIYQKKTYKLMNRI